MTSEPSAELRTSTLGPSDFMTAGAVDLTAIGQMAIGRLGAVRVLGSFEEDLLRILRRNGVPEESMPAISHETTRRVWATLLVVLGSYISAIASPKTEPQKPENTATSES